jgi:hypothetical protein
VGSGREVAAQPFYRQLSVALFSGFFEVIKLLFKSSEEKAAGIVQQCVLGSAVVADKAVKLV